MDHQLYGEWWRGRFVRRCGVEWGSGQEDAVCCNISADGVYIAIHPIPAVGERVQLRLELPGNEIPVAVEAEVCWDNSAQRHKVHNLPPGGALRLVALFPSDPNTISALVT